MSNVINLPTYEQVAEILAEVLDIDLSAIGIPTTPASNVLSGNAHAKLNWLLSILATVNTNTATANLGAANTGASNAVNAVAHAKLNWLLSTLATVNANSSKKPVLKTAGSGGSMPSNYGSITPTSSVGGTSFLNVNGSGRLLGFLGYSSSNYWITIDGSIKFQTGEWGYLDLPFSTSLQIHYTGFYPSLILYELNT